MNETLAFGQDGIDLVRLAEGLRLNAYRDSVGVLTIGYGHTEGVYEGQVIDEEQAVDFLAHDIRSAELAVKKLVKVQLTQHQFDALCDFTFNLGTGALANSTLLKMLNYGNYAGASEEFKRWDHAGDKVLAGLTKRRAAEAALFNA